MTPYYTDEQITLHLGDALLVAEMMPSNTADCIVTSPPYYGLRDYGIDGQYGLEASPAEYVETMRALFAELRRVLAEDGTLWLNLGSSYVHKGPSGPQGKTGQRAGRTFTAEGAGGVRRGARQYGKTCTTQSDSTGLGCACSDPDGGRVGAQSNHTAGSDQHPRVADEPSTQTVRDSGSQDCGPASLGVSAPGAQASTSPQSSQPLQDSCSRSDMCALDLSARHSSPLDAQASGRMAECNCGTSRIESDDRSQGMDALGTAWLNYSENLPEKSLLPIPWMVAMSLQQDGWILRNAIIWAKPNAMPESVTDRLSGRYEHVFLFSKSRRYWFDLDAIREPHITANRPLSARGPQPDPGRWASGAGLKNRHRTSDNAGIGRDDAGRNPGDVWKIPTQPFPGAHFACFPIQLPQRCILAGCKPGGTVLDPFSGSGTTGYAAQRTGRRYIGVDINAEYLNLTLKTRLHNAVLDFEEPA